MPNNCLRDNIKWVKKSRQRLSSFNEVKQKLASSSKLKTFIEKRHWVWTAYKSISKQATIKKIIHFPETYTVKTATFIFIPRAENFHSGGQKFHCGGNLLSKTWKIPQQRKYSQISIQGCLYYYYENDSSFQTVYRTKYESASGEAVPISGNVDVVVLEIQEFDQFLLY